METGLTFVLLFFFLSAFLFREGEHFQLSAIRMFRNCPFPKNRIQTASCILEGHKMLTGSLQDEITSSATHTTVD